jgi:glycosyltransferase involved in cell wall biosynthesis
VTGSPYRVRVAYFVPPSEHFAGIERVVHEIASGLVEWYGDVLEVSVIYASRYHEAVLENPPYQAHVLGVDRLRQIAGALRRLVAEHRFDVFVCPQVEASVTTWLATRGLGLPVFVPHLHGNPQVEEAQGTRRTRLAFTLFRHLVSPRTSGVLVVSASLGRYVEQHVAPRSPVHFVPNPVRTLDGATIRSPSPGRFRFLSVGRLSHQKGQDLLLEALALARPSLPPVELTLVGSGPEEARLRRLTRQLGLEDIVHFAGYVSDPSPYFRSADCFVLASRWEGFGVVLVEALQFGLPLLAAECDFGPADVITDPRIGDLVPVGDVAGLSDGLRRAASSGTRPGHEAYRRAAASRHGRREVATLHLEVLSKLVGSKSRARNQLVQIAAGPTQ